MAKETPVEDAGGKKKGDVSKRKRYSIEMGAMWGTRHRTIGKKFYCPLSPQRNEKKNCEA